MNSSSDLPGRLALFSWRQPVRLLLILLLPTLILGILALRLAVDASVLGALTDDDPDVVQLRELQEVFPHSGALVLLIEGGQEEERQRAALEAEEVFGSLEVVEDVRAHWSSTEELERLLWTAEDHRIDQIETLASGPLSTALGREDRGLGLLIMQLVNPLSVRAHSASLVTKQLELLAGGQTDVDSPGIPVEDGWYRSPDRSLYLVDLQTSLDPIGGQVDPLGYLSLDRALDEFRAQYPELEIALGGLAAVSYQDSAAVLSRILPLSTVSFFLVLLLLWRLSRSSLAVISVGLSLLVSLVWAGGMLSLCFSYLSFLAAGFAVILFGLGIDFASHVLLRFDHERREGRPTEEAIARAWGQTGHGVLVGGLTTAGAFFAISFIDFKAAIHLGVASGIGILMALLAMFTVLPALLRLVDGHREIPPPPRTAEVLARWVRLSLRYRKAVLAAFTIMVVFAAWKVPSLTLEQDLRQIMTQDLPALDASDKVKARLDITLEPVGVLVEGEQETRELAQRLEELPEVSRVLGWTSFFTMDREARSAQLERIASMLSEPVEVVEINSDQWTRNLSSLRQLIERWPPDETRESALQSLTILETVPIHEHNQRLVQFREDLAAAASTSGDLPPHMERRLRLDDSFLLQIYPTDNEISVDAINRFRTAVHALAPEAAGPYFVIDQMIVGGFDRIASSLAIIGCLLVSVLLFDLRRPFLVVAAMLPLISGTALALGVVILLDLPFTLVMLTAFPLIFGIGVDDGVHVLHRWREADGDLPQVIGQVGHAILFTTLSTALSFSVLLALNHNGFFGLAVLAMLGVGGCFLTSIALLPILLDASEKHRQ